MEDTTGVTLEQMVYHTTIVRRAVKKAILIADLPINTYRTPEESVDNGQQLIDAGADAVKIEGGIGQLEKIRAMVDHDIPMIGHLGMLPQRVREEGGYKKKGKTDKEGQALIEAAKSICDAGVVMIVLESITTGIATDITEQIDVPTLGIGSGPHCSGQIRVLHDVIGAYPWFVPGFAKVYTNVAEQVSRALKQYREELK
jgi:3-methyl-2-oxobutanoate hydroxymethyltransferase